MNNILCLKWGTLYSAEYVNRLYRGVKAHLHRPFRFVCVTDDKTGLCEGVDAVDFPLEAIWPWYRRMKLRRKAKRYLKHIRETYDIQQ